MLKSIHGAVLKVLTEVQLLRVEVRQLHDAVRKLSQALATPPKPPPPPGPGGKT